MDGIYFIVSVLFINLFSGGKDTSVFIVDKNVCLIHTFQNNIYIYIYELFVRYKKNRISQNFFFIYCDLRRKMFL